MKKLFFLKKTYKNVQKPIKMFKTYKNVQVYASNPWDLASIAFISNLYIFNRKKDSPNVIDLTINPTESLKENNVIATMAILEKSYTVSFKLKPLSFSKGWHSILHISKGQNYGHDGDRNPAVFFHEDGSGRLAVFSAINGKSNPQFITKKPLPLNKWSHINISQHLINGNYMFSIDIDNERVYQIENKEPRSFKNMKVYIADPWYTAHDGEISELYVFNGNEGISKVYDAALLPRDRVDDPTERKLQENTLVGIIRVLKSQFSLSFKIKPSSYSEGNHSVFKFIEAEIPYLILSAHFQGDGKLAISAESVKFTTKDPLPLNKWSSIEISQSAGGSHNKSLSYNFNIYLDDEVISTTQHNTTQTREFVKVYFGDPWFPVQDGYIKDLQLSND